MIWPITIKARDYSDTKQSRVVVFIVIVVVKWALVAVDTTIAVGVVLSNKTESWELE